MDHVAQVREKIDLVSLISEYIPLKKTGRNFKANCPFHNEKTPSFVVSPERQIWHCFGGCQKGGDCFTFLMEYEHLEFPEALRTLAKKAGVEIIETSAWRTQTTSKKEKIYALNHLAMEFYHYILTKHNAGEKARKYLIEERKISEKVIDTFMLGFSPNVGNSLSQYLTKKKPYTQEELVESGLSIVKRGKLFDFFFGRIMFPLFDHRGNVVGFSARAMSNDVMPKYINTRETMVYQKGHHFYGLNLVKDDIKKSNKAIIMEGEFDVISAFQEGVTNAIGVKGSALTEQQVNLLSRFTHNIALCFDMDAAGQEAIRRSLPTLEKKGMLVHVVVLKDYKDPDEALKKDPYAFKNAVKHDQNIYDFLIAESLVSYGTQTIEAKKSITDDLLPFLSGIENEVIKEHFLRKLSREIDTSFESLQRQLGKIGKRELISIEKPNESQGKKSRIELLEEYLLALVVQSEISQELIVQLTAKLTGYLFKNPSYKRLLDAYLAFHTMDTGRPTRIIEMLPAELIDTYDRCFLFPIPPFSKNEKVIEEMIKVAKDLAVTFAKQKIKDLSTQMKEKEKEGAFVEVEALQQELEQFVEQLHELSK